MDPGGKLLILLSILGILVLLALFCCYFIYFFLIKYLNRVDERPDDGPFLTLSLCDYSFGLSPFERGDCLSPIRKKVEQYIGGTQ
ncbi:hypothetical protein QN277_005658 [Acacia crassicarpa]|uniref:Uncharacterized protein n=1 Tax=Acacia crassicarpa TaxID=499986 RepID=A0AAE1MBT4_9FABA|nr:hypothetical protein QN277_005658 [Acacia crassicarpa]